MGILEIVILSLVVLLLFSIGWFAGIAQLLIKTFMDKGRAFLQDSIEDRLEQPETKKKSKKSRRL
jgi:hypothetical protein